MIAASLILPRLRPPNDPPTAQHPHSPEQDAGLPWRHGRLWFFQAQRQGVTHPIDPGPGRGGPIPELDLQLLSLGRAGAPANSGRPARLPGVELLPRPHHHLPGVGSDFQDEDGLGKPPGEPFSLTYGEPGIPLMFPDHLPSAVTMGSRFQRRVGGIQAPSEQVPVVSGGDEADLLGLGFVSREKAHVPGKARTRALSAPRPESGGRGGRP